MRVGAQGVDRLQRHHGAADAVSAARADGDPRTDDRSPDLEGPVGLRRGLVSPGDDAAGARRRSGAAALEVLHARHARRGVLVGGTLTQLMASLGTPWAFDAAGRLRPVSRRHRRAAVSHPSAADAGGTGRHVRARARRSCSASFPVATSRAAIRRSSDVLRDFTDGVPRAGAVQFPVGPHQPARRGRCRSASRPRSSARPSPAVRILEAAVE